MTSFHLSTEIFQDIEQGSELVYKEGLENFAHLIAPLMGMCVSLYFIFMALNWMWSGKTSDLPIGDFIKRVFYLSMISLFGFNIEYYKSGVINPINSIGIEIARVFSKDKDKTSTEIIDQMVDQMMNTIDIIWQKKQDISFFNLEFEHLIQIILTILIVLICGCIFISFSFLYLILAKIMISLLLLLGPLYISFAFFSLTREYFLKWIGQLLNYTLLFTIVSITFNLLSSLLENYISGPAFQKPLLGMEIQIKLIFCYMVFLGILYSLPSFTSHITSGVGLNLGQMTERVLSPLKSFSLNSIPISRNKNDSLNRVAGKGSNYHLG
jgi:type IV secretion system protein VirB6